MQGGDPTGTGNGGESIYDGGAFSEPREEGGIWPMEDRKGVNLGQRGVGFKDELHSRLKFNRRGLLGMANEGADTNGSQFFITLGITPELQGKNTLFGRVEGETIYNVAKMGEIEVEEGSDRPVYPVKITGVEILVNPFKDMAKRARVAEVVKEKVPEVKKKRKAGKQLLSFGDDDGEEEAQPVPKKTKFDTRIVVENEEPDLVPKSKAAKEIKKRVNRSISTSSSPEPPPGLPIAIPNRAAKVDRELSTSPEPVRKVTSLIDQTNAQIAALKASMKRTVPAAPVKEKKKSALEDMIPATSVRARKRGVNKNSSATDQKALNILKAFRSKLDQAPPEKIPPPNTNTGDVKDDNGEADNSEEAALCDLHFIADCQSCRKWDAEDENDKEEDDGIGWMSHALSFKEDKLGKDLTYRKKAEDELVVIDSREKARTLKEEMRAQREAKTGGRRRAWDQARNDKLARSSAQAGRGAK